MKRVCLESPLRLRSRVQRCRTVSSSSASIMPSIAGTRRSPSMCCD